MAQSSPSTIVSLFFLLLAPPSSSAFSASDGSGAAHGRRVFISTPQQYPIRTVSDCMTAEPFLLSPHTLVDNAIAQLLAADVSGAPVVEGLRSAQEDGGDGRRLVGFVSSFDFLPREESGSLVPLGDLEDSETARRILGRTVGNIMTMDPVTVGPDDLMKTAAEVMAKKRLHALPVVDQTNGNLVGIITAKDVMRDVMKTAKKSLPSEEDMAATRDAIDALSP